MASLLGAGIAPDAPIADAAMRGDRNEVRSLLKAGADVNVAQGDGMTALHWAAEMGDAEMAEMLIYAGANPEAMTRIGDYTPLHTAAEIGHGAIVKVLLQAGANPQAMSSNGGTMPLHFAARSGSIDAIVALIEHGADINGREQRWGQTPLMFAAAKGHAAAVELLLRHGADPSLTTKVVDVARRAQQDRQAQGVRQSVMNAFRNQAPDPVAWIPDASQVQAAIRASHPFDTLADDEIVRVDWEVVQMEGRVLRYPDYVGYQGGLTALLHAVREGHRDAAMVLLDGGAAINQVSAGDLTSPLLMAMINGHYDLGLELLERGADPTIASDAGATPLYAALNTNWAPKARYPQQLAYQQQNVTYLDVMKALLDAGADPNVRLKKHLWYMEYTFSRLGLDTWGATPFLRAAHALDVDAMKLLVSYGADPNIPTKRPPEAVTRDVSSAIGEDQSGLPPVPVGGPGVYPIHVATGFGGEWVAAAGNSHRHVPNGWLPAIKYLVEELGADVTVRDYTGHNVIHHAAGRGLNDLILYLVEKGADPLAMARSGRTTVDMANGPVSLGAAPMPETIALLERLGAKKNLPCAYC